MDIKPVLLAAVIGIIPIHAAAQNPELVFSTDSLSLDDCLSIALNNSPTVKVADMEVKRMDYSKKEIIGNFNDYGYGGVYAGRLRLQRRRR